MPPARDIDRILARPAPSERRVLALKLLPVVCAIPAAVLAFGALLWGWNGAAAAVALLPAVVVAVVTAYELRLVRLVQAFREYARR